MIIALPDGLPACETLRKEGLAVIEGYEDMLTMLEPVRIALVNLMPDKQRTETQFARLLGRTPYPVELTLVRPDTHVSKGTSIDYMTRFYKPWSDVRAQHFDGLIITGAPVEQLPFEEVTYWQELGEMFDWASASLGHSMYVCWAGQAFLHHRYGINKQMMFTKLFGIFEQTVLSADDPAMRNIGASFRTPVSRHTEVHEMDLSEHPSLTVVARCEITGACIVRDQASGAVINFNHLEYDADTLAREYLRDREAVRETLVPENYFPGNDPAAQPIKSWASSANAFVSNWVSEARERGKVKRQGRQEAQAGS